MIKFYFHPSPNPAKVALFLEESGLPYELMPVDTRKGEQHQPAFRAINPNGKTPAIVDGDVTVFDSNAILIYLAEKTGKFLPAQTPAARGEFLSWMMFVASGIGPFSGQAVHFKHFAPKGLDYAINRYDFEANRHYAIIDAQLAKHGGLGMGARGAVRSGRRSLGEVSQPETVAGRNQRPPGRAARRGPEGKACVQDRYGRRREAAYVSAERPPRRLRPRRPAPQQARAGRSAQACSLEPNDGIVERAEEIRSVARRESLGAAGRIAGGAQMVHQVSCGERHADRRVGETPAGRRQNLRACLDAAARERNVGGHDDACLSRPRCDPVVGGVRIRANHDLLDRRDAGNPDRSIRDHIDFQAVAVGDPVNLVLHRAGVGVDENFDRHVFPNPPAPLDARRASRQFTTRRWSLRTTTSEGRLTAIKKGISRE